MKKKRKMGTSEEKGHVSIAPTAEKEKPGPTQVQKVVVADADTEQKIILSTRPPEPEFKDKVPILDGGRIVVKSEVIFICDEPGCGAIFTQEVSLNIHKNKHRDRKLRCNFCGWGGFKSPEEQQKHLTRFHPNLEEIPEANRLQCQDCKKISTGEYALRRHILKAHQDCKFPCPHCGYQFTHQDNLVVHLKHKHLPKGVQRPTFSCEVCGKMFHVNTQLKKHLRTAHRDPDKTYHCVVCKTIYYSIDVYRNHLRYHGQARTFSCDICDAHFKSKSKLERHKASINHKTMAMPRNKRKLRDRKPRIDADYPPPQKSLQELRQMGKQELFDFCWERVPKIILMKVDSLDLRMSIAHREKRLRESNVSSKVTSKKGKKELYHLKCVDCKESFPDMETLKLHEKTCFNVLRYGVGGPYKCSVCQKVFKKRGQLAKHTLVHSDERPFKCHYCDSAFKWRSAVIVHEKHVHFGVPHEKSDRIFMCNYAGCDKKFSTDKSLKRHIQSKHIGTRFSCPEPGCGKEFSRDDYLKKHKEICHPKEMVQIECKPCMKVFKHRTFFLAHCKKPRHIWKMKMFSWNVGEKEEEGQEN